MSMFLQFDETSYFEFADFLICFSLDDVFNIVMTGTCLSEVSVSGPYNA